MIETYLVYSGRYFCPRTTQTFAFATPQGSHQGLGTGKMTTAVTNGERVAILNKQANGKGSNDVADHKNLHSTENRIVTLEPLLR